MEEMATRMGETATRMGEIATRMGKMATRMGEMATNNVSICSFYTAASAHYVKKLVLQIFHTNLVNRGSFQASLVQVDSWVFMLGLTRTIRCQM